MSELWHGRIRGSWLQNRFKAICCRLPMATQEMTTCQKIRQRSNDGVGGQHGKPTGHGHTTAKSK